MRVTLSPVVRTFGADDPSPQPSPLLFGSLPPARRDSDAPLEGVEFSHPSFAGSDRPSQAGLVQEALIQADGEAPGPSDVYPPVASLSPSLPDDLVEAAETLARGAGDLEPALRAWLAPVMAEDTTTAPLSSPPVAPLNMFGSLAADVGAADAGLPDRAQLADMARASLSSPGASASAVSLALLDAPAAQPLCQEQMWGGGEKRMRLAFDIAGSDVVGVTQSGRLQVCFMPALASCEPLYVDLDRDAARALARQILQLDDDGIPDGVAGIFNAPW